MLAICVFRYLAVGKVVRWKNKKDDKGVKAD